MIADFESAIAAFKAAQALPKSPDDTETLNEILADTVMVQKLLAAMKDGTFPSYKAESLGQPDSAQSDERRNQSAAAGDTFVFFHIDGEDAHPFVKLSTTSDAPVIDYKQTLKTAVQFALHAAAKADVILLTDETSDMSAFEGRCEIIRSSVDPTKMMYSRMRAYRAITASGRLRGATYFLDTDVCVLPTITTAFDGHFDIGLTFRSRPHTNHMPLNEGVILAAHGDSPATLHFFDRCLELYEALAVHPAVVERYGFDVRHWRGGQLSLAALVQWRVPPFVTDDITIDGLRVRFLPGSTYNYAVKATDDVQALASKAGLHFKGVGAKLRMADFATHRGLS